jgi:chemotaxis protein CheX
MKDKITLENQCVLLRADAELAGPAGTEALAALCEAVEARRDELKAVILDLGGRFALDSLFVKELGGLLRLLKPGQRSVHSRAFFIVRAPRATLKLLQELGMDGAVHCLHTLEGVYAQLGIAAAPPAKPQAAPGPGRINVDFVNPFIDGAMETLKTQCSTECKPERIFVKGTAEQPVVDIAGVLGITSPGFRGSLAICFPKRVFLGLMERMLGEKSDEITAELEDGAGELLNIVFGFAKRVLNERGYQLEKAIPTVLRGSGILVKHLGPGPSIILPFRADLGQFYIEICSDPPQLNKAE